MLNRSHTDIEAAFTFDTRSIRRSHQSCPDFCGMLRRFRRPSRCVMMDLRVNVLSLTQHKIYHFGDFLRSQSLGLVYGRNCKPDTTKANTHPEHKSTTTQNKHKLEMWAEDAQRDGRPAEYRWRPLLNAAVWLTPTTRVSCSRPNAAETRNPLKLAGVPQTNETISAASMPKFTRS